MRKIYSASEFRLGQKVITKNDYEGIVVGIYGQRYVDVELIGGSIYVAIPAHGDIKTIKRY